MSNHNTILAFTGMRSFKLYGNDPRHPGYIRMIKSLITYLDKHPDIVKVYIGMAAGSDLMMGLAVINFNKMHDKDIELVCSIPGRNQTKSYSKKEVEIYKYILDKTNSIEILSEDNINPDNLKARNRHMVDKSTRLLSMWDNVHYKSGTWSTISYAKDSNKTVYNINPLNPHEQEILYLSVKK